MAFTENKFTMTGIVVVLVVVGTLISVLFPFVLKAREDARRAQCMSNLKQLALGCLNHELACKEFPTNGWGSDWLGDCNRGVLANVKPALNQPGGWLFNIVVYSVDSHFFERQRGKVYGTSDRLEAITEMCQTCDLTFICPSRRAAKPYPFTHKPTANGGTTSFYTSGLFCDASGNSLVSVAKTDYAGNGGQTYFSADTLPGDKMCDSTGPIGSPVPPQPNPYVLFDTAMKDDTPIQDGTGRWKLTPRQGIEKFAAAADGIFYPFSAVTKADITDGDSYTYLIGEKFLPIEHYEDGLDDGDDQCAYMGHDKDITRWAENEITKAISSPLRDCPSAKVPGANSLFGSAHLDGCNMAFCDGSVHFVSYTIDPTVHANLANRKDGNAIPPASMPP